MVIWINPHMMLLPFKSLLLMLSNILEFANLWVYFSFIAANIPLDHLEEMKQHLIFLQVLPFVTLLGILFVTFSGVKSSDRDLHLGPIKRSRMEEAGCYNVHPWKWTWNQKKSPVCFKGNSSEANLHSWVPAIHEFQGANIPSQAGNVCSFMFLPLKMACEMIPLQLARISSTIYSK